MGMTTLRNKGAPGADGLPTRSGPRQEDPALAIASMRVGALARLPPRVTQCVTHLIHHKLEPMARGRPEIHGCVFMVWGDACLSHVRGQQS
jgi:hypothetical protein